MRKLVFIIALLGLGACTKSQEVAAPHSNDVVIGKAPENKKLKPRQALAETDLSQCRANIEKIVCWVDPLTDDHAPPESRQCLTGGEKFVPYFQGHFDRSPAFIQKMYCHLDYIWIEKNFIATAYAYVGKNSDGRVSSAGVGIREEILGSPLKLDEGLSWKEETSFGGTTHTSDPRMGIIQYKSNRSTPEFFLDYVMNHEFGHLFDFSNDLNKTTECEYKETSPGKWERIGTCEPLPGTWGEISWKNIDLPKPEQDYLLRDKVCFYFCNGNFIARENAPVLFEGLTRTEFPSIYASRYPSEDFAEALALHIAHDLFGFKYSVVALGQTFDMTAHYYSAQIESKRNYVKNFLSGQYRYPGEE